ncbi:hypothetical protein PCE1_000037 [Barthelona sp. PCE]
MTYTIPTHTTNISIAHIDFNPLDVSPQAKSSPIRSANKAERLRKLRIQSLHREKQRKIEEAREYGQKTKLLANAIRKRESDAKKRRVRNFKQSLKASKMCFQQINLRKKSQSDERARPHTSMGFSRNAPQVSDVMTDFELEEKFPTMMFNFNTEDRVYPSRAFVPAAATSYGGGFTLNCYNAKRKMQKKAVFSPPKRPKTSKKKRRPRPRTASRQNIDHYIRQRPQSSLL